MKRETIMWLRDGDTYISPSGTVYTIGSGLDRITIDRLKCTPDDSLRARKLTKQTRAAVKQRKAEAQQHEQPAAEYTFIAGELVQVPGCDVGTFFGRHRSREAHVYFPNDDGTSRCWYSELRPVPATPGCAVRHVETGEIGLVRATWREGGVPLLAITHHGGEVSSLEPPAVWRVIAKPRAAAPAQPAPEQPLQVGDRVEIIAVLYGGRLPVGTVSTIERLGHNDYELAPANGGCWYRADELRRVPAPEQPTTGAQIKAAARRPLGECYDQWGNLLYAALTALADTPRADSGGSGYILMRPDAHGPSLYATCHGSGTAETAPAKTPCHACGSQDWAATNVEEHKPPMCNLCCPGEICLRYGHRMKCDGPDCVRCQTAPAYRITCGNCGNDLGESAQGIPLVMPCCDACDYSGPSLAPADTLALSLTQCADDCEDLYAASLMCQAAQRIAQLEAVATAARAFAAAVQDFLCPCEGVDWESGLTRLSAALDTFGAALAKLGGAE